MKVQNQEGKCGVLEKSALLMTPWVLYTEEGGCQFVSKSLLGIIFIHRPLDLQFLHETHFYMDWTILPTNGSTVCVFRACWRPKLASFSSNVLVDLAWSGRMSLMGVRLGSSRHSSLLYQIIVHFRFIHHKICFHSASIHIDVLIYF
jgi:hypothetical protein